MDEEELPSSGAWPGQRSELPNAHLGVPQGTPGEGEHGGRAGKGEHGAVGDKRCLWQEIVTDKNKSSSLLRARLFIPGSNSSTGCSPLLRMFSRVGEFHSSREQPASQAEPGAQPQPGTALPFGTDPEPPVGTPLGCCCCSCLGSSSSPSFFTFPSRRSSALSDLQRFPTDGVEPSVNLG